MGWNPTRGRGAEDRDPALVRGLEPCDDSERGGLAGAVGTEYAHDLPWVGFQVDAAKRLDPWLAEAGRKGHGYVF